VLYVDLNLSAWSTPFMYMLYNLQAEGTELPLSNHPFVFGWQMWHHHHSWSTELKCSFCHAKL
jgi:hypothetical protein